MHLRLGLKPVKFEELLLSGVKCLKSSAFACSLDRSTFGLPAHTQSTRFRLNLVSTSADSWVSAKVSLAFRTCELSSLKSIFIVQFYWISADVGVKALSVIKIKR